MKQEAKEKLVAALRSGEFKKTRGMLKQGDCYCALGVLCAAYGATFSKGGANAYYKGVEGYQGEQHIPLSLAEETGITVLEQDLVVTWNDAPRRALRDGGPRYRTFPEIADLIEANL